MKLNYSTNRSVGMEHCICCKYVAMFDGASSFDGIISSWDVLTVELIVQPKRSVEIEHFSGHKYVCHVRRSCM